MLTVLVVSPVRIYREGIVDGLHALGRFQATAARPEQTALVSRPDVVVYDVGAAEGPRAVQEIVARWSEARVVILGVEQSAEVVPWAEAGASGFVGRDASLEALCRAVDAAGRGELLCTPGVAAAICGRLASVARVTLESGRSGLSHREWEIAGLIEQGMTNKEIAGLLSIQPATVKNHVHRILGKLGARRRAEAAARIRALQAGSSARPPQPTRAAPSSLDALQRQF